MAASFPTAIKAFTTHVGGDSIQPAHVNDAQDEIAAIETQLLTSGSWTIALTSAGGGVPVYAAPTNGYYLKVGKSVQLSGVITLSGLGTLAAGGLGITGLPFAAASDTGAHQHAAITYWGGLTVAKVGLGLLLAPSGTSFTLTTVGAAAALATSSLLLADISATFQIIFTITYRAAS